MDRSTDQYPGEKHMNGTQQSLFPTSKAAPMFDYDINNADFVDFFIRHTGYLLRDTLCGWDKIRDEFANPAHEIDPGSMFYVSTENGVEFIDYARPIPIEEGRSIKKVWDKTRSKLQASWDIYSRRQIVSGCTHAERAFA
jgi:hypothetical protein